MKRSDLVDRLAARAVTLTPKDAELSVSLILDALASALARGERIEIRGFGSFVLSYRPSRQGRNPASGEPVQIPAKYLPHFKVGKVLRERVDYVDESLQPHVLPYNERRGTHDAEASHDAWFQAKVRAALDDPRPTIPHDQVEDHFAQRRVAALNK